MVGLRYSAASLLRICLDTFSMSWRETGLGNGVQWCTSYCSGALPTGSFASVSHHLHPPRYEAGAAKYDFPVEAQLPIFWLVMGFLETKRYIGFKETGTVRSGWEADGFPATASHTNAISAGAASLSTA
jgi:hypothetical protein